MAFALFGISQTGESLFKITGLSNFVISITTYLLGPIFGLLIALHHSREIFQVLSKYHFTRRWFVRSTRKEVGSQNEAPKLYPKYDLISIAISLVLVVIFASAIVMLLISGEYPKLLSKIQLNITSTQNVSDSNKQSVTSFADNNNNLSISNNKVFSKYI
jgi:hypothetical protein